jgi:hypothetical protein
MGLYQIALETLVTSLAGVDGKTTVRRYQKGGYCYTQGHDGRETRAPTFGIFEWVVEPFA